MKIFSLLPRFSRLALAPLFALAVASVCPSAAVAVLVTVDLTDTSNSPVSVASLGAAAAGKILKLTLELAAPAGDVNAEISIDITDSSGGFYSLATFAGAPSSPGEPPVPYGNLNNGPHFLALYDKITWEVNLGATPGEILSTINFFGRDSNSDAFIQASLTYDLVDAVNQVPVPGALPLFASGLGALGLIHWRRKRRAQTA